MTRAGSAPWAAAAHVAKYDHKAENGPDHSCRDACPASHHGIHLVNCYRQYSASDCFAERAWRCDIGAHDNTTFSARFARKPSLTPVSYPGTVDIRRGRMEYLGFVVEAFEQRARQMAGENLRSSGKPLITGRKRIWQFVTGIDATTAPAALLMALEAIDAETFSSAAPLPEKFWRRHGRRAKRRHWMTTLSLRHTRSRTAQAKAIANRSDQRTGADARSKERPAMGTSVRFSGKCEENPSSGVRPPTSAVR